MFAGAVVLTIASVLVGLMVALCAAGRIGRNPVVGLRLPSLFASDETWIVGHKAAVAPAVVSAIGCVVLTVIVATVPSFAVVGTFLILFVLLAGVVIAAVLGGRAARRVSDQ